MKQPHRISDHRKSLMGRVRLLWPILALAAVTIAVFAPVWTFGFVSFDDPWYVSQNPNVAGGFTWQSVRWALTTGSFFYWHPLTWLSHLLDVQIYGMQAGGHHLTNLLLHVFSTLALFGLLRRMTGAVWRSAFVAALFAVHPLHVESVAWIAERKDVLSTLLSILTLWAYAAYVARRTTGRYAAVLLCFAAGLMAKPMLVTLPVVLILLDIWPLRRIVISPGRRATGAVRSTSNRVAALTVLGEKIPFFAVAIAVSVATFFVQYRVGAAGTLAQLPISFRLANGVIGYVRYIGQVVWPAGLAVFYPYPPALPPWWQVAGAAAALVPVTVLAVRTAGSRPYIFVGWMWYLVMLLPVIGLFQAGDRLMADRFTYMPIVGLFLIVAWGVGDLLERHARLRPVVATVALLVVAAFATIAYAQVQYWRDSETLWRRALAVTTANHRAHAALGGVLAEQGKTDEAIAEYREALRILPTQAEWRNELGLLYTKQNKIMEAMGQYALATRARPGYAEAHNNLGAMLARAGRRKEAIAEYTEAIRLAPSYAAAYANLALALADEGRLDEALQECLEALKLEPTNADWHYQAASLFDRLGRRADARAYVEKTLKLNPQHEAARQALERLNREGG
jgi:tetratricopeptide (TPR) repeat protein